ncbi:MAG TPA: maleylpyruvate isomerase family mycothiol-dependent enzyme [Streptosporangiaceae bacterium]|nr:maleylpyruvate isomerase family mycothiol-dependent enzyme [Streptosporangiaceae bacterium]
MSALPAELYYAEIDASTATLAALADSADPDLPIATCPDWTLRQLATHLGRAQRWAAEIVRTRSAEFIEFRAVPDGRLPDDETARGRWLTAGAARLISALREAGEAEVWAFGELTQAGFWGRRMSHEAMVHCVDAQLACGAEISLTPELAADAIDEWLTVMSGPIFGRADPRLTALPPGRSLHIHAADPELATGGEWQLAHAGDGIHVTAEHGKADAALSGAAADVLLVLLGRKPVTDPAVRAFGDHQLLTTWLTEMSF